MKYDKTFETSAKKESYHDSLVEAYVSIREKDPAGLDDWEIARDIVEVLDDPLWVDSDLAKECVYSIVQVIQYPDDQTKKKIILAAEEKARTVFPELRSVDEVHMDQIDYAYHRWKNIKP